MVHQVGIFDPFLATQLSGLFMKILGIQDEVEGNADDKANGQTSNEAKLDDGP